MNKYRPAIRRGRRAGLRRPGRRAPFGGDLRFPQPVTKKGTVKEIRVINPHTHMMLTITDAKGTRDWDFEGHSA